jgi:ABC-2 type transporter
VDGFRYAFFGQADIDPWLSLSIVATAWLLLALLAMRLLHRGYHLRY